MSMRGFIHDLPEQDYHASEGLSASVVWACASNVPARVRHQFDNPRQTTDSMALGTITHAAILEPERVEREYVVIVKPDLRTKVGKQEWAEAHAAAEARGQTIVSQQDFDLARGMRDAVHAHPLARNLLEHGAPEVSLYADDPDTGLLLRGREDWMPEGLNIVCDLKTARDADDGFSRDAYKFGYHAKAHHYRYVRHLLTGEWPEYLWLVVEPEPPHLCAVYAPDPDMESLGEIDWRRGVEAWRECTESGKWPGLPTDVISLPPPRWARHRLDSIENMGIEL